MFERFSTVLLPTHRLEGGAACPPGRFDEREAPNEETKRFVTNTLKHKELLAQCPLAIEAETEQMRGWISTINTFGTHAFLSKR
jgi:hypothetical protein